MLLLKEFLSFLYAKPASVVQIGAVKISDESEEDENLGTASSETKLKFKIGLLVTNVMSFLLVASFLAIVAFSFFLPDKEMPNIFRDILIAVLGYFGGAFTSFYKLRDE